MAVTINGTTGITNTGDYDAEDGDKILLTSKDAVSLKYTIDPKIQEELERQLKEHLEKKEDWLNDC